MINTHYSKYGDFLLNGITNYFFVLVRLEYTSSMTTSRPLYARLYHNLLAKFFVLLKGLIYTVVAAMHI